MQWWLWGVNPNAGATLVHLPLTLHDCASLAIYLFLIMITYTSAAYAFAIHTVRQHTAYHIILTVESNSGCVLFFALSSETLKAFRTRTLAKRACIHRYEVNIAYCRMETNWHQKSKL